MNIKKNTFRERSIKIETPYNGIRIFRVFFCLFHTVMKINACLQIKIYQKLNVFLFLFVCNICSTAATITELLSNNSEKIKIKYINML